MLRKRPLEQITCNPDATTASRQNPVNPRPQDVSYPCNGDGKRSVRGVTIVSSVTCDNRIVLRTQHLSPCSDLTRSFSILPFDAGGYRNAPLEIALPGGCFQVPT